MPDTATLEHGAQPTKRRHTRRELAILAIPQMILFGGMALMLVVHPNAVKSGVMSTRAIVVNAVLLGGWLLLSFVILPRLLRNVVARSAVLTVGAIAAVIVLVVPTLRDKKVVEKFPEVAVQQPQANRETPEVDDTTESTPPPAAQPVRVSSGEIRGIDHDATGTATVYRQPDGTFVVGLESIDIEPGPDYRVYVVPTPEAESPGDGTEIDALRGNQGTQYYTVPADVGEVGDGWTVLVWCRAFGVPVAAGTQRAI